MLDTLKEIKIHYEITIEELYEIIEYDKYVLNEYNKWIKNHNEPFEPFDLVDIEEIPLIRKDIIKNNKKIKKLKKQYYLILDIIRTK